MSRRVMLIGLLVLSAVVMLGTEASAQSFDGWGWFGFSEVTGVIDLRGVPNPDTKPTIVFVTATLNVVEVMCTNPNDMTGPAQPGNAGVREVSAANQVSPQEVVGRGQATVTITFDLGFAETNASCVNPNWNVVIGSAGVKDMSVKMEVFRCTGDVKTDPDPCFEGTTLTVDPAKDTVNLHCTLDPIDRDEFLHTSSGQVFTCVEV